MPAEPEEQEVELSEGMPVKNEAGDVLGKLAGLLVADDDQDDAEFVLVNDGTVERLIPYDAIIGVGDGNLLLDVPALAMAKFPKMRPDIEPTDAEIDLSYAVFDEHAEYEEDTDE